MSRFNRRGARPAAGSPGATTGERATTHEGGAGHLRDTRSELFLLAVGNFVGADTFYERGERRDDRYAQLIRRLAVTDPHWCTGFLRWLRTGAHMRTTSPVGAAEFTKARFEAGAAGYSRQVVDSVLQRADEPGEFLGYWMATYGRKLPKPVKRGVADAVQRLYDERSLLRYDTDSKGYRFGDVLNLVHPGPAADKLWQGDLFQHALDRRMKRDASIPAILPVLRASRMLTSLPVQERRSYVQDPTLITPPGGLAGAGFTWERLAGWLQGPMDAAAWEAVIPSMGLMALARNLRNFATPGRSTSPGAEASSGSSSGTGRSAAPTSPPPSRSTGPPTTASSSSPTNRAVPAGCPPTCRATAGCARRRSTTSSRRTFPSTCGTWPATRPARCPAEPATGTPWAA